MKKINEIELQELFYRLKQKEDTAYEELYQKYSPLVYQIAFSILKNKENAEDIMQNVFLKIAKLSEDKLPSKYEASWLYSVTKNEAISFLRKNKETFPVEEEMKEAKKDEFEELMQKDAYEKMISSLEQKEKQIVSLKVETGLSFKEIASLLNMPMGTVQWKYYKSLHHIKLLIGNLSLLIVATVLCVTKLSRKDKKAERIEEKQENEITIGKEEMSKESEKHTQVTAEMKKDETEIELESQQKEDFSIEEMRVNTNQEYQTEEQQITQRDREGSYEMTGGIVLSSITVCSLILLSIVIMRKRK